MFKNSKTGKVEQISSSDIELVNWQRLAGAWGLRVFLKSGALHRYGGFKDSVSLLLSTQNYTNHLSNHRNFIFLLQYEGSRQIGKVFHPNLQKRHARERTKCQRMELGPC